jgi:hypothetical protein
VDCSDPRNCRSASCDRRHLGSLQPHNGLIDSDTYDPWSIDLERGSTDDWLDESMETKESYVLGVGKACWLPERLMLLPL